MTAATKRLSKILLALTAVALIASGCFVAPPSGAASEPGSVPSTAPEASGPPAITGDLSDQAIGRYGTRTKATFRVVASGARLRYTWQRRSATGGWKTIAGARKASYTAKASAWASGTRFRVIVSGTGGKVVSSTAKLTVLTPTKTPAKDAEAAFGLTGIRQGVDLSSYQYTPSGRISMKAVDAWAGPKGFTLLRNGSGARPIKQPYTNACTGKAARTGTKPVTRDCAYPTLAGKAKAAKLSLGHYWFNGWISPIDTTKAKLFAGGYTTTASAKQFVAWLKSSGRYTKSSTDPLVLDVEKGHAWTKTYKGKSYTRKLRAWKPAEAAQFLTTVKRLLTEDGYSANLYVYMSANAASKVDPDTGSFVWTPVAGIARLWVASWGTNNGRIPDTQPKVGPWDGYGGWSIWQYTSNARIAGDKISSGLDADIARADAWTPR